MSQHWFALVVRPRHEKSVAFILERKGYETFLPLYKTRHRYANRTREFTLPLFPGYLFSRFDVEKCLPVMTTPGVVRLLGFGKAPTPVDEAEVESLRMAVARQLTLEPTSYLEAGCKVRISEGPLEGITGVIVRKVKPMRLVLSITLLKRSVCVEVDAQHLIPAGRGHGVATHVC